MKKLHKITAVMFALIAFYSSQPMSATATNLKCKGCAGSSDIAKNAVTGSRIKNNSVSNSKIKDSAVTRDKPGFDVTDELYELRSGKQSTTRTVIDIDCNTNANTLLEPPYIGSYHPNTTFNITGACNGPIRVYSDGVHFIGMDSNRAASIVLPNPTKNPSVGAVSADGAHDLRLQNLTIDASAWGTWAIAEDSDAAGVYARNAFVRLIDVDVKGGLYGINPFRNAIVSMEGEINITEFVTVGIASGDRSIVRANGQVNVGTTRTDGDDVEGVAAYRSGVVNLRDGLVVTVPAVLDNAEIPTAIVSGGHSLVQVKDGESGTVSITGDISTYNIGFVNIDSGTIAGNIYSGGGSTIVLGDTTQTTGDISVVDGSTIRLNDTTQTTGDISVYSQKWPRLSEQ